MNVADFSLFFFLLPLLVLSLKACCEASIGEQHKKSFIREKVRGGGGTEEKITWLFFLLPKV